MLSPVRSEQATRCLPVSALIVNQCAGGRTALLTGPRPQHRKALLCLVENVQVAKSFLQTGLTVLQAGVHC